MQPLLLIRSSAGLNLFVTNLIDGDKYSKKVRKTSLDDYLSSLWHMALHYNAAPRLTYDLIADLLVKALEYPPIPYDWTPSLQKEYMYQWETLSAANTPEYFAEIKTYAFFERRIKRQIIDLKRMNRGLPLPPFVRWENQTVEGFLERGTYSEDEEEDEILTWGDFSAILGQGQWTE